MSRYQIKFSANIARRDSWFGFYGNAVARKSTAYKRAHELLTRFPDRKFVRIEDTKNHESVYLTLRDPL